MEKIPLGEICDGHAKRDAVHVAILPAQAGHTLRPGEIVRVDSYGFAFAASKGLGIVDPFLRDAVRRNQFFYVCVFPNTVIGMRHHWSHPEVCDDVNNGAIDNCSESERWIREFADSLGADYDWLIKEAETGWITFRGTGAGSVPAPERARDDAQAQQHLFWEHWCRVTGKQMPSGEIVWTCSC